MPGLIARQDVRETVYILRQLSFNSQILGYLREPVPAVVVVVVVAVAVAGCRKF